MPDNSGQTAVNGKVSKNKTWTANGGSRSRSSTPRDGQATDSGNSDRGRGRGGHGRGGGRGRENGQTPLASAQGDTQQIDGSEDYGGGHDVRLNQLIRAAMGPMGDEPDFETEAERDEFVTLLKQAREAERAKAIKDGKIDPPGTRKRLAEARDVVGICEDMCPRYERYEREKERNIGQWEQRSDNPRRIDHKRAVKAYQRAPGDTAIPSDLRTLPTLQRTVDYLFTDLMERHGFRATHAFIRDRYRAIKTDCGVQGLRNKRESIEIHEKILRYSFLSTRVESEDKRPLEISQCADTLGILRDAYDAVRDKWESPFELEMRVYDQLFFTMADTLRDPPLPIQRQVVWQVASRFRQHVRRTNPKANKKNAARVDEVGFKIINELDAHLQAKGVTGGRYLIACIMEAVFEQGMIEGVDDLERSIAPKDVVLGTLSSSSSIQSGGTLQPTQEYAAATAKALALQVRPKGTRSLPDGPLTPSQDVSRDNDTASVGASEPPSIEAVAPQPSSSTAPTPAPVAAPLASSPAPSAFANLVTKPSPFATKSVFGGASAFGQPSSSNAVFGPSATELPSRPGGGTLTTKGSDPSAQAFPFIGAGSGSSTFGPATSWQTHPPAAHPETTHSSSQQPTTFTSYFQADKLSQAGSAPEPTTPFDAARLSELNPSAAPFTPFTSSWRPSGQRSEGFPSVNGPFSQLTVPSPPPPNAPPTAGPTVQTFTSDLPLFSGSGGSSAQPTVTSLAFPWPPSPVSSQWASAPVSIPPSSSSTTGIDQSKPNPPLLTTSVEKAVDHSILSPRTPLDKMPALPRHQTISLPTTPTAPSPEQTNFPKPTLKLTKLHPTSTNGAAEMPSPLVLSSPTEFSRAPNVPLSPTTSRNNLASAAAEPLAEWERSLLHSKPILVNFPASPAPPAPAPKPSSVSVKHSAAPSVSSPLANGKSHKKARDKQAMKAGGDDFRVKHLLSHHMNLWERRTADRAAYYEAEERRAAYQKRTVRRPNGLNPERKRRSSTDGTGQPPKRVRKRAVRPYHEPLTDEQLARRFENNKETQERLWTPRTFLNILRQYAREHRVPYHWATWLSLTEPGYGTANWVKCKFDLPASGKFERDVYSVLPLETSLPLEYPAYPGLIVFETTSLRGVTDEIDRKCLVLDDCARLRDVIAALPADRHFIPSLLGLSYEGAEEGRADFEKMVAKLVNDGTLKSYQMVHFVDGNQDKETAVAEGLNRMDMDVEGRRAERLTLRDSFDMLQASSAEFQSEWMKTCAVGEHFDWALYGGLVRAVVGLYNVMKDCVATLLSLGDLPDLLPPIDVSLVCDSTSTYNTMLGWLESVGPVTSHVMNNIHSSFMLLRRDFPCAKFLEDLRELAYVQLETLVTKDIGRVCYVSEGNLTAARQQFQLSVESEASTLRKTYNGLARRSPQRVSWSPDSVSQSVLSASQKIRLTSSIGSPLVYHDGASTSNGASSPSPSTVPSASTPAPEKPLVTVAMLRAQIKGARTYLKRSG